MAGLKGSEDAWSRESRIHVGSSLLVPFPWFTKTIRRGLPGEGDTAMSHQSTASGHGSSVSWETLEAWARQEIQVFLQALLREEVTAVLGRRKSACAATMIRRGRNRVWPLPGCRRRDSTLRSKEVSRKLFKLLRAAEDIGKGGRSDCV